METNKIGSLDVSVVGLGCNNFGRRVDEDGTRRVVDAALDAGVTFFDTADIYGGTKSETFLGEILTGRRDRVVLATKFGMEVSSDKKGAHPDYIRRAVRDSLTRLRTDHIDLYQLHQPDPGVPIGDTLATLDELVREGLVREIGCSNFDAAQLSEAEDAVAAGAARFVSVQNELSLLERADEHDGLKAAGTLGLAYIPYFPLASGVLTGKYVRGESPPSGTRLASYGETVSENEFDLIDAYTAFAGERGRSLLELAIGWLLSLRPVASVITGATMPEQIEANAAASDVAAHGRRAGGDRGDRRMSGKETTMAEIHPGVFVSSIDTDAWEPDEEVGGDVHILCTDVGIDAGMSRFMTSARRACQLHTTRQGDRRGDRGPCPCRDRRRSDGRARAGRARLPARRRRMHVARRAGLQRGVGARRLTGPSAAPNRSGWPLTRPRRRRHTEIERCLSFEWKEDRHEDPVRARLEVRQRREGGRGVP